MTDPNQIRINELARELGIKAKVLIDYLPEAGVTEKKTHSSSIEVAAGVRVREHFRELADAESAAEEKAASDKAAKEAAARAARMKSSVGAPPPSLPVIPAPMVVEAAPLPAPPVAAVPGPIETKRATPVPAPVKPAPVPPAAPEETASVPRPAVTRPTAQRLGDKGRPFQRGTVMASTGGSIDRTTATLAQHIIRSGRSSLRTTFQLAADLDVPNGLTVDAVFERAAHVTIDWLEYKLRVTFPRHARDIESFDLDHHGQQQHVSAVSLSEDGLWSIRLIEPDLAVAGRTWTTEIALHKGSQCVRMAIRVLCASAPHAMEPITLTRPRVVINLAKKFGLREIRLLDGHPWLLGTDDDVRALYDLLTNDKRTLPIILLTQPDHRQRQVRLADYVLDQTLLAQHTQGMAHVMCMPMDLGVAWTEMVGKAWSAFHGAIRTYNPRVNLDEDSPFVHPLALLDRVLSWRRNDQEGEAAFASFLIDKMAEYAAVKSLDWGKCLFFADARTRGAEIARERIQQAVLLQPDADKAGALRLQIDALQKAHKEEVDALTANIAEARKFAEDFDRVSSDYKSDADRLARVNRSLQLQNDVLRLAIKKKTRKSADSAIKIPETYDEMPEWVEDQLAGRLVFHPRAVQGVKKAEYEDIGLVYKSLMLLAGEYRDMRLGHPGAKKAWEDGRIRLKLRLANSITEGRAGEHGETYYVRFPIGSEHRQFLDLHVCKGVTKDDRNCMRIYFFFDEDNDQVVVGSLPGHLETRAT